MEALWGTMEARLALKSEFVEVHEIAENGSEVLLGVSHFSHGDTVSG
jgi:hypothetical protein